MFPWTVRRLIILSGAGIASIASYKYFGKPQNVVIAETKIDLKKISTKGLPSRKAHLKALAETVEYDILVIGGGATGAGIALDSVTRGLKTALVEMSDFSSGTSSRSTKLIHGGVRYLQKAIMKLDYDQYKMVKEALNERANLLQIAPHLSYPVPIMLPVYHWWQVPYYWFGIKMYDLVAGLKNVKSSYYLTKKQAIEKFPMLKKEKLCGAIVYYDGQHNDARMNLALILTAIRYGANIANYCAVTKLYKNDKGKLYGARVKDQISGNEFDVRAKCIINATGPFTDSIRLMDNPKARKICQPSSGVHITLPGYYSPQDMGLLDPATSDGRVIFFLPWQKSTIAGTTDKPCDVTSNPSPTESDIQFILMEIKKYLNPDVVVRRGDVLSAWAGIRPLVLDPSKPNTESIARNHIIDVSNSGLITIAGGKWTTYRSMAYETIEVALKHFPELKPKYGCQTEGLLLEGAEEWSPTMFIRLVQNYGLDPEVANHLSNTYGDRAFAVAKLAEMTGKRWPVVGNRLHPDFPYIGAEIRFAIREYACTAIDVIARRLRLSFLNVEVAQEVLPKVIEIMAQELKWSKKEQQLQHEKAIEFLHTEMGQSANRESKQSETHINLSPEEIYKYTNQFHSMDKDKKGYIGINDLRRSFKSAGLKMTEEQLNSMLSEVDVNNNGKVELDEYLVLVNSIKTGTISQSRLAHIVQLEYDKDIDTHYKSKISVERSGGGF